MIEHLVKWFKAPLKQIRIGSSPETERRKIIDQHGNDGRLNKVNLARFYISDAKSKIFFTKHKLFFTINLEILPHFRDLNDRTLPDHLHDEVHEDYDISECSMVKSYRFA
ncbi:hypothetical protein TNCV_4652391 [Trichonephila clavipes]|nr:hypothetical protein TNCV_4652391 [Trichonephila clavipes]